MLINVAVYGLLLVGGHMKRKKKYDKSVYKSFALISQFGINMLVPIGLMTWLGIYLDGKLGTSYWMIILFFVGAIAGGRNVYHVSKSIFDKNAGKMTETENDRETEED